MRLLQVFRVFKVRESGNVEFWISNLVIMASTVMGVYLAALAGYKTALEFEVARGERDGYYMRRALVDELKDNLAAVKTWGEEFQAQLNKSGTIPDHLQELQQGADPEMVADGQAWVAWWQAATAFRFTNIHTNPSELKLATFTWDTLKQQSSTFQLPVEYISNVRRYYGGIESNMRDVSTRDHITKTMQAAVAIWKDTRRMRQEVLPLLEKDIAEVRASLISKGIPIK
jgi:hypothetical protein